MFVNADLVPRAPSFFAYKGETSMTKGEKLELSKRFYNNIGGLQIIH